MPGFELIGNEERAAVNEVFDDGGVLFRHGWEAQRKGRYRVREFEAAFARKLGCSHALAVSSGTAALKVALKAMGVGPGDEVVTQAFTFIATVEAILDVGAIPVLANVDETLNMDPQDLKRVITPRTRVVLPVHMLGVAARMNEILRIAKKHNLPVLEDACEALGASWDGRPLGTLGRVGVFSFDFGKTLTTGEGGMLVTNDEELAKLALEYHDHGHENNPELPRGRDTRRIWGFNYRMNELSAAVGLAQLEKLDRIIEKNRQNYKAMQEGLEGIDGIRFRSIPSESDSLSDTLILTLPSSEAADRFAATMSRTGVSTKVLPDAWDWHFAGKWTHMFSADMLKQNLEPSRQLLSRCVALPILVQDTPELISGKVQKLREVAHEILVPTKEGG